MNKKGEPLVKLEENDPEVICAILKRCGFETDNYYFAENHDCFARADENHGLGYMEEPVKAEDIYSVLDECSAMAYHGILHAVID